MVDLLPLLTGIDIPYEEAQIIIHQPTIEEISFMGETEFFSGCELLNFDKSRINNKQGKNELDKFSNFQILMQLIGSNMDESRQLKKQLLQFLSMILPKYTINFTPSSIVLLEQNGEEVITHMIDDSNFNDFNNLVRKILGIDKVFGSDSFNASGPKAQAIINKIREGQKRRQRKNSGTETSSIFARYLSILTIGNHLNLNDLKKYTVFQLFDVFERYQKKMSYDTYISAKMAGAQNLQKVDNWLEDLYSNNNKKQENNYGLWNA